MRRERTTTFKCEYSQNHSNNPKIIFKEGKDSIEEIINSSLKKNGRFSMSERRDQNYMTVTISSVRPDDGGVYFCGVQINTLSYSYSIITTVHLHIIMGECTVEPDVTFHCCNSIQSPDSKQPINV